MTTRIEWTDETWNPISGCSKVSQGCKNCYAERMWKRLSAKNMPYEGRPFTDVKCHPERLDQPLRWKKPRRIFVNSMSDLFHEDVPDEFIDQVIGVASWAKHHVFQILTKRPERAHRYFTELAEDGGRRAAESVDRLFISCKRTPIHPDDLVIQCHQHGWPLDNVWLGVSVEDQSTADERIPLLLDTPAIVRWISAEPLIGPVDLTYFPIECPNLPDDCCGGQAYDNPLSRYHACESCEGPEMYAGTGIDWVVVGGESGPRARPMHPDWVRSLRDQCRDADTAFFFKQWGTWLPASEGGQGERGRLLRMTLHGDGESGHRGAWLRTGKKTAGRSLDGEILMEFPV